MDLATITMDRQAARQAFLEYRHEVRERHSAEDAEIMRGYQALSRGQQLIHLSDTIRAGGLNKQGLPALAACRADAPWCYLSVRTSWDGGGWRPLHAAFAPSESPAHNSRQVFRVTMTEEMTTSSTWGKRAMVPVVPAGLRPKHHLRNYVTLFEVEEWKAKPRPPGDPALLKRIGGDLFAVVAIWDLTELEKAVLSGRRG